MFTFFLLVVGDSLRQLGPAVRCFCFGQLKYGNQQVCVKHDRQDKLENSRPVLSPCSPSAYLFFTPSQGDDNSNKGMLEFRYLSLQMLEL